MIVTSSDSTSTSIQRKLKGKVRKQCRSLQNISNPHDVINVLGPRVSEFGHKDKVTVYNPFLQKHYDFFNAIPEGQKRPQYTLSQFVTPRNDQFTKLTPMIKMTF